MNRKKGSNDLNEHFIDDLDPYDGEISIPVPEMTEENSEQSWSDFQDSIQTQYNKKD